MNHRSIVATLLIVALLGTLVAVNSDECKIEAVFTGQGFVLQYRYDSNPLNLTSRANIYEYIQNNPGTHLRNICASLSISIGSAQYHLEQLVEGDLIESEKESKYKRFFVSRCFTEFEKRLIAFLRKPNARMIIKYTSMAGGCSHQELAKLLEVSSQAVTWHVKRLMDEDVLDSWTVENSTYYRVTDTARDALMSLGHRF